MDSYRAGGTPGGYRDRGHQRGRVDGVVLLVLRDLVHAEAAYGTRPRTGSKTSNYTYKWLQSGETTPKRQQATYDFINRF
jgi:hypothetical protein